MVTGGNTQIVATENVCAADEDKIICIIRDMVDTQCHGIKHTSNLPVSTKIVDFVKETVDKFGYVENTVEVHYENQTGAVVAEVSLAVEEFQTKCLGDIATTGIRKHNFTISEKEGVLPQKVESQDSTSQSAAASTSSSSSTYFSSGAVSSPNDSYTYSTYPDSSSSYTYASALIKSDTGYVGLVNQAMTCYLNSLLQTLYMTPEFRNAIYRWEFDGSEEEKIKSIPYQLQKLFLQLQTSKKRAAETTDLTRSFGWDSSEVWQQHDVQELCRVMFDALEHKWKNTDQAHLINNLYQGKVKDYVKCLECENESARLDTFLDIPLVIRPFGLNITYGSVEEALKAFVEPETLCDNNQYFCEKCNKKCDAHKGLKFITFPYLLTLQLKRFDFDYETMHRIKLNDRMSFTDVLNLNHLVETDKSEIGMNTDEKATNGPVEDSSDEGIDEGIEVENFASGASSDTSSLSSEAVANDRNAKDLGAKGPYVYELFSIMVHSGSAAGGHYYAYIKSFKDGQWYSFNDQHVCKITYEEITKTYGGSNAVRGYYSAAYSSSTNAYMLMYRQIDKDGNVDFIQPEDFPEHLKRQLQQVKEKEEAERRQKELDKSTCKIKVYYFNPLLKRRVEQKLEIHKDKTLADATETCHKLFNLDKSISLDCCRLVKFDEYQDTLECSFEVEDDTVIGKLLGGVKQAYNFDLLLETKRPDQVFQEYKPGGVTVKVYVADLARDCIEEPVSVRAYHVNTVSEFKDIVSEVLNIPNTDMRCVLERFHNDLKLLSVPNKTLKAEGFFKSNKVYVECVGEGKDEKVSFQDSRLYKLLDRHQNTIRIHVNLPPQSEVEEFLVSSTRHDQLMKKAIQVSTGKSVDNMMTCLETRSKNGSDSLDEGISDRGSDSEVDFRVKSLTLHHSRSDPSIYHSCQSIDIGRISPLGLVTRGRPSSPVGHSSTSQDSSTSAEYSLPPNGITALNVDNPEERPDNFLGDTHNREPVEHGDSDSEQTSPPSPGERVARDMEFKQEENWEPENDVKEEKPSKKYFHVVNDEMDVLTRQRHLTVLVDKRITLGAFKKELEPMVGTTSKNFKVYRVYSNNQEFESIRLSETLSFFEDGKLNIKLGRALRPGEYRVKVYQLLINDPEPCKFLIDTIFAKGMTVLESKNLILPEIKDQCNIDIPLDRCRLRKKTWKNPITVYIDNQVYDDEVHIFANWEVFLQVLHGPEVMTYPSQLAIFVRRWRPSKHELDPFQEIILSSQSVDDLKQNLADISDIPVEDIEYAKGRGTFPCDTSLLEIHTDLDWSPHVTTLNAWPLYICDDGSVLYYRDKKESLQELSKEKKKELQQKENARLARGTTRCSYSPRKERALKIYTDDHPPSSSNKLPDLD